MKEDAGVAEGGVMFNRMLALVAFNAGIGGFLYGYDTSSISASLLQMKNPDSFSACPGLGRHPLGPFTMELITSFTTLGAFFSALFAGCVSDRVGRHGVLMFAAVTFVLGAAMMGFSTSVPMMLVARIIAGLAVGVASHTTPCYVSECCPASIRGTMVTVMNVMIVVGQTVAAGFATIMFYSEVHQGWRWILGVGAFPALFMIVGLLFLPESPRWLLSKGRDDEAKAALILLRSGAPLDDVEAEFIAIRSGVKEELRACDSGECNEGAMETISRKYWQDSAVRRALMLGCFLQAVQQLIGINTVMYYGAQVVAMAAGADTNKETCFSKKNKLSVALNTLLSAGQGLGVMSSLAIIDRVGRRPLALSSLTGSFVGLVGVGIAFSVEDVSEFAVIAFVLVYVYMFGIGISPVPYVVNSEIYPIHVRGPCISLSTATNWLMDFLVSVSFLTLARSMSTFNSDPMHHPNGVFFLYAAIALFGLVVLYFKMPETKGLSLEETSQLFLHEEEKRLRSMRPEDGYATVDPYKLG